MTIRWYRTDFWMASIGREGRDQALYAVEFGESHSVGHLDQFFLAERLGIGLLRSQDIEGGGSTSIELGLLGLKPFLGG